MTKNSLCKLKYYRKNKQNKIMEYFFNGAGGQGNEKQEEKYLKIREPIHYAQCQNNRCSRKKEKGGKGR